MGEIFPREIAPHPETFTGERLTSALGGQTQIEHYHRYLFARALCADRDVLDVASGEGYGTAMLAQVARSATGVEYAAATAQLAAGNFVRPNLRYLQGDARALPLPDAAFDVVVSFETIEHFDRQADFVREVKRVLRPGGLFIVSTPDRDSYTAANAPANPFHVCELSRNEFTALLASAFPHIELLLHAPSAAAPLVFDRRGDTHFEACAGLSRAPYIVAVASDGPLPALPPSLYIDRSDLDTASHTVADLERRLREAHVALDAVQAAAARAETEAASRIQLLSRELDHVRGSMRTFLRHYMPRLRRHLHLG